MKNPKRKTTDTQLMCFENVIVKHALMYTVQVQAIKKLDL